MELVEAFEQLSLRLKLNHQLTDSGHCKNGENNTNDPDESLRQALINLSATSWPSEPTSVNNSSRNSEHQKQLQLQDFDRSIETLFSQINTLESASIKSSQQLPQESNQDEKISVFHHRMLKNHKPRDSMDTSQEEDSDNSSQKSFIYRTATNNKIYSVQPFVESLLERDLNAITNTVIKIGRILAFGKEIEFIYKNLMDNRKTKSDQESEQAFDPNHCKSLCNAFICLCSSEPCISDLPTIVRYNEYCLRLMCHFDQTTDPFSSTPELSNSSDVVENVGSINVLNKEELMCLDDACDELDCELLECDERNLGDNWTESKLYETCG